MSVIDVFQITPFKIQIGTFYIMILLILGMEYTSMCSSLSGCMYKECGIYNSI